MPVTWQHYSGLSDAPGSTIGEQQATYTDEATTVYLEPGTGAGRAYSSRMESEADRNTPIGEWFGVVRGSLDPQSGDRCIYQGKILQMIGPPAPFTNPTTGELSHVEVSLREIDQ